ncbi:bumetanide-sensitive sodium-(potassium)-chloride cotransporter [Neocloeon triangulifer]|uniref:bumetanide-sensitive sodium-(potassium)-chloride cotransporter n=1 Tax=Neocloeon triangulifer TaxID=2078957 RepID=UPI00286F730F|nr:bumetanide-sensitive sodium-(potassium)-chloride cotransporter [Neocloeon triangulifer]
MDSSRFSVRQVIETRRRNSNMADVPENGVLETNLSMDPQPSAAHLGPRRSLVHMTREALPRMDNYRNLLSIQAAQRPTLGELHEGVKDDKDEPTGEAHGGGGHHFKLGWIQGVLIPVLLNIWGVMLFLRLSWVVAQAGVTMSLVIIGISAGVCVITTLSLSAISTNGEVKGGGIYYIISRSLGPEFGASVGIVFAFANAVAASMNTIGFCDSLNDLLKSHGLKIIDGGINDVRLVGMIALVIMIVICAVGMEWEVKAQNVLVVIISGAIVDFIVGTLRGPQSDEQIVKGFPGWSFDQLGKNMGTDYRFSEGVNQDFFSVFAIFFPSVTGIQAGANISGDLKDPASAIPKGTLLALAISMFSYGLFVILAGGGALRDASGMVEELANGTYVNCTARHCEYGLQNSYSVMQLMSVWGPFIYAGCFAATLSTALTNLLSVPKLVRALGYDKIYPGLIFFSKGYTKKDEPFRGYVLTFIISGAFLLIAELNVIAPLISNFYLASYALINFCTFHAAFVKPIGWRPTFRFYNKWLSLIGFIVCVAIMFLISWVTSLITYVIIIALYLVVVYRNPDVNWGSSTQAQTYNTTLGAVYSLNQTSEHVKNYRPQILLLSGNPTARPAVMQLASQITKNLSLLLCGKISEKELTYVQRSKCISDANKFLEANKVRAFFTVVDGLNFEQGARALLQATGIGKLRPNVLLMGYKNEWLLAPNAELHEYFNVLHEAFDNRLAVAILRVRGGLDFSQFTEHEEEQESGANGGNHSAPSLARVASDNFINLAYESTEGPLNHKYVLNSAKAVERTPQEILRHKRKTQSLEKNLFSGANGNPLPHEVLQCVAIFDSPPKKGTIDVWWLYDDGGLTLLLPYILTTRHNWSGCRLRIFALVNKKDQFEVEERNMASLLSKFRIDYASLTMIHNVSEKPHPSTNMFFEEIIKPFRERPGAADADVVKASELIALKYKTERQLRLRELLLQHSKDANLIVMTMPMPRKGVVSAPLYMAWLEVLSRDMPPFMLVRGNQTSVLSFYA